MKKAVVVGSGFGGLAVALRLIAKGYKVTILEARDKVGGRAYQLSAQGFTFDMGPSLVTAPPLFDELFGLFDKRKEDYFELVPLDPYYRIYFQHRNTDVPAFAQIDYNGNPEHMAHEMETLEKGGGEAYKRYFEATRPIFDASYNKYGGKAFLSLWEFLQLIPEMVRLRALLPMTTFVSQFFSSDFAIRTLSFHPLYIGTNPYEAPAALGFIPWLERDQGVWFAKGGMYSIIQALTTLVTEVGGEIRCGEPVISFKTEDGAITEVVTTKGSYPADIVVSNADVLTTYNLVDIPDKRIEKRKLNLKKKSYSMSLFMLYFGLNRQYHDKLAHHTLILGTEYKKLLDEIFNLKVKPTSLSMYLHIPSVTDSTMAPDGGESMYILIPVPNLSGDFTWNTDIEKELRDWVVRYLQEDFGLQNFSEAIVYEHHMTPLHFETDLRSTYGAAFATQLSLLQSVYFREHNKAQEVPNLYFVGAGTHPGPGVPGVLLSAKATASVIPEVR